MWWSFLKEKQVLIISPDPLCCAAAAEDVLPSQSTHWSIHQMMRLTGGRGYEDTTAHRNTTDWLSAARKSPKTQETRHDGQYTCNVIQRSNQQWISMISLILEKSLLNYWSYLKMRKNYYYYNYIIHFKNFEIIKINKCIIYLLYYFALYMIYFIIVIYYTI